MTVTCTSTFMSLPHCLSCVCGELGELSGVGVVVAVDFRCCSNSDGCVFVYLDRVFAELSVID